MFPNLWVVTGTGTDVGKTVVTAGLLRAARRLGRSVQVVKAVQTGCAGGDAPDLVVYRQACPDAHCAVLRQFREPCSPHLAAAMEGQSLDASGLASAIHALSGDADITLVEGAGGLFVPLNETETFVDLIARLHGRIVVAAANGLGAINHCLLTLDALRQRGMAAEAVVATQVHPARSALDATIAEDNLAVMERMGRTALAALPHYPEFTEPAWQDVEDRPLPVARRLARPEPAAMDVVQFDHQHLWHPYAKTTPPQPVWEAAATRGTTIRLRDGQELVDGMASWWSAIHGYNHPALLDALHAQASAMPHVMFGGLTHEPAAGLAERLLRLAPEGLSRVFYVDSGSVAVEAALKMAVQYQHAIGRPAKRRMLTALGGYHGDTFGAMSVCDPVNGMHQLFTGTVAEQLFVERPRCRFGDRFDDDALQPMRDAFARHGDSIAAVILEPIVQNAGGMWFYHPDYLKGVRALCDEYGALLILDEIATNFGRTGRMFAAEWAGISPDILCVGKALTGGVMTLAAVLATETVASAISRDGVFMHGPTYMANPLACAVASASLDLLTASPWQERVAGLEAQFRDGLEPCRDAPGVRDVRVLGGIGVVEMESPVNTVALPPFFVRQGVWLRPFGRWIYAMPPYVATAEDMARITGAMRRAVEEGIWR